MALQGQAEVLTDTAATSEHSIVHLRRQVAQPHPFQPWLRRRVLEVHGVDLLQLDTLAEFAFGSSTVTGAEP